MSVKKHHEVQVQCPVKTLARGVARVPGDT